MIAAQTAPSNQTVATTPNMSEATKVLRTAMQREDKFHKVHAAEALIELGLPEGVRDVFVSQEHEHRGMPGYRLGIWRVLARLSSGTPEHDQWVGNLRRVAMDPASPDRIAAVESLAKIKYPLKSDERPVMEALAASDDEGIALYATWLLFQTPGSGNPQDRVARYLDSKDPISRLRAIYILRFLPDLSAENRAKLKAAARAEARDTLTYAYSTSSSFIVARTFHDEDEVRRTRGELYHILQSGKPAEKQEACRALGEQGSTDDLEFIVPLLEDPAPPARIGAGLAIARLRR